MSHWTPDYIRRCKDGLIEFWHLGHAAGDHTAASFANVLDEALKEITRLQKQNRAMREALEDARAILDAEECKMTDRQKVVEGLDVIESAQIKMKEGE